MRLSLGTSGYAEEYGCISGNNGNYREQELGNSWNTECRNGKHTETVTLGKDIGLLQAAEYLHIPLQKKDLHTLDTMTYPRRTSPCIIYD